MAGAAIADALVTASAPASPSPGFIQNASTAPHSNRTMLPMKGSSQLCVLSITYPAMIGETIAADAEPIFIKPLAEPENRGAISIGIAHIGPIVNSEKKKAALSRGRARCAGEIVDEKNRRHRGDRKQEAGNHQVAPRLVAIPRGLQHAVAGDAAKQIPEHAGEKDAGREKRRIFQVQLIAMQKK